MSQVQAMIAKARQKSDFEMVTKHYGCPPEEIAEMREIANRDRANARECFAYLAKKISEGLA